MQLGSGAGWIGSDDVVELVGLEVDVGLVVD